MLILIRGAGDLASGVAHRLHRCGFDVVMTDIPKPTTVRCTVAFSQVLYEGTATVEGVTGRLAQSPQDALAILRGGELPVLADPELTCLEVLRPDALVDAVIAKRNIGTKITHAPIVVALGPGFTAGVDCHAVVETKRGHTLGSVLYEGSAIANTGVPGNIGGYTTERILRAPTDGIFEPLCAIGHKIQKGQAAAMVNGQPVLPALDGVVRGLLPKGTPVTKGMKSGDVDPRGIVEYCYTISDKARAIAGGVMEAILSLSRQKGGTYL